MILREEEYPNWEAKDYKGPLDADNIQFSLGNCEDDGDELMQADTIPIFNKAAY